jgi:hypothetical protein
LKVPAGAKEAEPKPCNVKALDEVVAYEAEDIDPEMAIPPWAVIFPVTVNEPDMVGELSIILFCF